MIEWSESSAGDGWLDLEGATGDNAPPSFAEKRSPATLEPWWTSACCFKRAFRMHAGARSCAAIRERGSASFFAPP